MQITPHKIIRRDVCWGKHAKRNFLNRRILAELEKENKKVFRFDSISIQRGLDWTLCGNVSKKIKVKQKKKPTDNRRKQ